MEKAYITPHCNVETLRGQYLMLGVSTDAKSTDDGNSDKSKHSWKNKNFWTGEFTDEDTSSGESFPWK
jgi:hypothetical protein